MLAGAVGAIGLVIQIILGFALAGTANPKGSALIVPHVVIGVAGLALVAYLAVSIIRAPSLSTAKVVYLLALVLTIAQVALGYALLENAGQGVLMAHQGIAVLILVLMAVGGMASARGRRMAPQPAVPQTSPS